MFTCTAVSDDTVFLHMGLWLCGGKYAWQQRPFRADGLRAEQKHFTSSPFTVPASIRRGSPLCFAPALRAAVRSAREAKDGERKRALKKKQSAFR
ncbi:unnamed protein product [Boreogadus saida]